jgi:hypothetical protein
VVSRQDVQELADAILVGTERRHQQSFGTYFGPEGGSCALGAAYEGIYLLPRDVQGTRPKRLDRFFDCLENVSRRCPAGCRKQVPIAAMIVHLNDDHRWSRERIAAWLRGSQGAGVSSRTAESRDRPSSPASHTSADATSD